MNILMRNLVLSTFLAGSIAAVATASDFNPEDRDLRGMAIATNAQGRAIELYQSFINQGRNNSAQNLRNGLLVHVARMRNVIGGSTVDWDRLAPHTATLESIVYRLSHLVLARPIAALTALPYRELVDELLNMRADVMGFDVAGEVRAMARGSYNPYAGRIADWAIAKFEEENMQDMRLGYDRMVAFTSNNFNEADFAGVMAMFNYEYGLNRNIALTMMEIIAVRGIIAEINGIPVGPAEPLSFGNFAARFLDVLNLVPADRRQELLDRCPSGRKARMMLWYTSYDGVEPTTALADEWQVDVERDLRVKAELVDAANFVSLTDRSFWRAALAYNIPQFRFELQRIAAAEGLNLHELHLTARDEIEFIRLGARQAENPDEVIPQYMLNFKRAALALIEANEGRLAMSREASQFAQQYGRQNPGGLASQADLDDLLSRLNLLNAGRSVRLNVKTFMQLPFDFLFADMSLDEYRVTWPELTAILQGLIENVQLDLDDISLDLIPAVQRVGLSVEAGRRLTRALAIRALLEGQRPGLAAPNYDDIRARLNRVIRYARSEDPANAGHPRHSDKALLINMIHGAGVACNDGVIDYVRAMECEEMLRDLGVAQHTGPDLLQEISKAKRALIKRVIRSRELIDFGDEYRVVVAPYIENMFSSIYDRRLQEIGSPAYAISNIYGINAPEMLRRHLFQGDMSEGMRVALVEKFIADFTQEALRTRLDAGIREGVLQRLRARDIAGLRGVAVGVADLQLLVNRYSDILERVQGDGRSMLSTLDLINYFKSIGRLNTVAGEFILYSPEHPGEAAAVFDIEGDSVLLDGAGPNTRGWLYILQRLGLVEVAGPHMQEILERGTINGEGIDALLAREDREIKDSRALQDDNFYR